MSSVSSVQTCETWNYVEYSSPLVYSKFTLVTLKNQFGKLKIKVLISNKGG